MPFKITLDDLKIAKLLQENFEKIVKIIFLLNSNRNMIRTVYSRFGKSFGQIEAHHIGRLLIFT
jgi:hypothetical protein